MLFLHVPAVLSEDSREEACLELLIKADAEVLLLESRAPEDGLHRNSEGPLADLGLGCPSRHVDFILLVLIGGVGVQDCDHILKMLVEGSLQRSDLPWFR